MTTYSLDVLFPNFEPVHVSPVAQMVKNLTVMQKTQVWSLGWKDSPRKRNGNPLQYSCLENPMDRGAWRAIVQGLQRVRHNWATNTTIVLYLILTVASLPAYRFLRRQVRWLDILISWRDFPVCCDPHSQRLYLSQRCRSRCFSGILLFFLWSSGCWQFDLWLLAFSKSSFFIW